MALDPFGTIQKPAQRANLRRNRNAERLFQRMTCGHLIRDGTNATNTRRDIRHFVYRSTTQKALKKPRWLVDVKLNMLDLVTIELHIQRPLAFDTRQRLDFKSSIS